MPRKSASGPAVEFSQEPSARVLRQFRQVFNAVKTHFQQVEKKVGLGGSLVWALSVLRDTPDIGMGDLARAMQIHQSTASNLVKTLIERELVVATKDEADRRAVRLRLTALGARQLRKSPGPFAGVLPAALASLDEKTLKRMEKDLAQLIEVLQVDEEAGGIPLSDM
ncbi:MarR family winged helix-turn-helix transcriptional regulator [Piscinibacter terrae]|uniref:MarR family transcriptional regulator n=1 Tax=Piscinibacter terrae TaxID=2496871 RepID=A0A3N7HUU6_9BURK|nr:MarR family winged helix-turn-helix transcriptional regulator [Albitalea terrae]RQP25603.1 MarR family transcriptional regulator [Albitalea terrae]